MDVPRPRRPRALRRALWISLGGIALGGIALALQQLEPPLPSVARTSIWTGRVEAGPFVVRVRGSGTLRPEAIRWLTTESSGRVEEILLEPGMAVEPDTPVVRLENLDLRLQALAASRDMHDTEAELIAHDRQTERDRLELEAELVSLNAEVESARRRSEAYIEMQGSVIPRLEGEDSARRLAELVDRSELGQQRLALLGRMAPRQRLGLERQRRESQSVEQVRREMVDRLLVRGSANGILQDVLVELGQWVVPGTAVAKVIVNRRLQAELRIPAEQAGGISVGQRAQIRTGYGSSKDAAMAGHVRRVAPAANEGTVEVEVVLDGEPPEGARPDQSVEGSIEIERTASTLHLPRPVGLALGDSSRFFRIDPTTHVASPVLARTGRVSVDSVEILSGLDEGDEVILSDTARFSNEAALRLE